MVLLICKTFFFSVPCIISVHFLPYATFVVNKCLYETELVLTLVWYSENIPVNVIC